MFEDVDENDHDFVRVGPILGESVVVEVAGGVRVLDVVTDDGVLDFDRVLGVLLLAN